MQTPILEEAEAVARAAKEAASDTGGARSEVQRVLGELQEKFAETADDAEELIAAHPFASLAAAFLLGILVANVMSRGR